MASKGSNTPTPDRYRLPDVPVEKRMFPDGCEHSIVHRDRELNRLRCSYYCWTLRPDPMP